MGDTDFLFQTFGDVSFPTQGSEVTNGQLFSVFDPARDRLLDLFKTAINQEIAHHQTVALSTSPWFVARASTNLSGLLPVEDTAYETPRRSMLRESNYKFPLLALYRTEFEANERFLNTEQITQTWGLDYILGPLKSEDYRRLGGALAVIPKILSLVIRSHGHPAFENGALQFFKGVGGLASLRMLRGVEGVASFGQDGEGLEFYSIHIDLESTELDGFVDGEAGDYEGSTLTLGVGSPFGGIVPNMLVVDGSVPFESGC